VQESHEIRPRPAFGLAGQQQRKPAERNVSDRPWRSGQRRLSVGGAITRFRHRSLRKAIGTHKKVRGCAATVGFKRTNSSTPAASTSAVGLGRRQSSSGKTFRDPWFEQRALTG
jgi:hypothetical protein